MKIFVGIVFVYMILYTSAVSAEITYKSSVDYDYGFYKVIGVDQKPATDAESAQTNFTTVNYIKKRLTINVGDTVMWINYDTKDWPLTIISEQGLWKESDSYLKYSYRRFNYTFIKPGIYDVYIKEHDKFSQTIIVNPIGTTVSTEIVETQEPIDIPVSTPILKTPMVPTETHSKMIPGLGIIGAIVVVLLALYFLRMV